MFVAYVNNYYLTHHPISVSFHLFYQKKNDTTEILLKTLKKPVPKTTLKLCKDIIVYLGQFLAHIHGFPQKLKKAFKTSSQVLFT